MSFYTFHVDGFGETSREFHCDDAAVGRAAFDTAMEVSSTLRRLVFVTVFDMDGQMVCREPRWPGPRFPVKSLTPGPSPL